MACDDFQYSPTGRRGIGLNQPQSGLDYPFVQPSPDIRYLIADFYFAYDDSNNTQHPLRVKGLYGFGCDSAAKPFWAAAFAHAADILIVDAFNNTVFDSTNASVAYPVTAFNTWCWGLRKNANCSPTHDFRIYEWISDRATCRVVIYQTWPADANDLDENAQRNYSNNFEPVRAVLDERAVYKIPKRVLSFRSHDNTKIIKQNVADFYAGYNTAITAGTVQTRGLRLTRQIVFNAIPGSGLGRYTDCAQQSSVYYAINGVNGPNVLLEPHDCIWTKTPNTVVPVGGIFKTTPQKIAGSAGQEIGSNCPACCTCQDYVDTALYMNKIRDRYKQIGTASSAVLTDYKNNIDRWLVQRDCRLGSPIKVCVTPQNCPYIDVLAQYCNSCEKCSENVVLTITITTDVNAQAEIVCGYTSASVTTFSIGGSFPTFIASLGNVDAGNSVSIQFRLKFNDVKTAATVSVTVTGTTKNGAIRAGCSDDTTEASAIITDSLNCDSSGNTTTTCL
jgi:hypothetical protein